MAAYRLQGTNEAGDPVEVLVEACWRCGVLVNLYLLSMAEHVDAAHPLLRDLPPADPPAGRHHDRA